MSRSPVPPGQYATAAFDALTANIAILDAQGCILVVNRAWREFGGDNDSPNGGDDVGSNYLTICETTQGEDRRDALQLAAGIRQVLDGEQPVFELEYPCHSPTELRYFLARVTRFEQGGRPYAVVAHENITRRKLAELEVRTLNRTLERRVHARTRELDESHVTLTGRNTELARSNRELAEFAHVASHDLQEPLRTLGAYTDLLRHRYRDQLDERGQGYLVHMQAQVTRARQLVRDVLTLASVEAQPSLEDLDLCPLWEEVCQGQAPPEDAQLICGPLPHVRANAAQMRQLLANLLSNALKFRAERPLQLTLHGWAEGPEVHLVLQDNGLGIAPEHAEQVFQMFQRLHSRSRSGGNGIGLAVCRKVVERHGGRIWIEPGEGQVGTAVHFTLPAAQTETVSSP